MSAFDEQPPVDKTIRFERNIPCTQYEIWEKFTTHDGLSTFFGTDNSIELRPGGKYEIYFELDAPEGLRGGEGNTIISFLKREQLSFTWNAPPQFPEVRNHEHKTWVMVSFNKINDSATQITLTHTGWLDGPIWDAVHEYFCKAWVIVLDRLGKCFEGRMCDITPSTDDMSSMSTSLQAIERRRRHIKAGADEMRQLGIELNSHEVIVRADELEQQARTEAFAFITNGYYDEHH
jgi:uncharacterized protein YndB with AHSA1/START domain